MDLRHVRDLRTNRVTFVSSLEANDVLDYLHEDECLSYTDCELISGGRTRKERTQLLLDILPKRGPNAYESFTRALKVANYEFLQEALTRKQLSLSDESEKRTKTLNEGFTSSINKRSYLNHYFKLIEENVEPNDILDYLYQECVLSGDECELVRQCKTRKTRCSAMLQQLSSCCLVRVASVLQTALKGKYCFINQIVEGDKRHNKPKHKSKKSKNRCTETNPGEDVARLQNSVQTNSSHLHSYSDTNLEENKFHHFLHQHSCLLSVKHNCVNKKFCRYTKTSSSSECSIYEDSKSEKCFQRKKTRKRKRKLKITSFVPKVKCPFNTHYSSETLLPGRNRWENILNLERCHENRKCTFINRPLGSSKSPLELKTYLVVAFNYLSTLINQGQVNLFERFATAFQNKYCNDPDLMCLLEYLHASSELFKTNTDSAKKHLTTALEMVPKTSNPEYFTVEILSARTRMYLGKRQLEKFQTTLDDALMIIESHSTYFGHGAGWLYLNQARNYMTQMGFLNFSHANSITALKMLHEKSADSLRKSICFFQEDVGKDGPFGFGYAICRLVVLLLQCGDNGRTMKVLKPSNENINLAGNHLRVLESTQNGMPKILQMYFNLAKCDYYYRKGNTQLAIDHAEIANKLEIELQVLEFSRNATNRLVNLMTEGTIQT